MSRKFGIELEFVPNLSADSLVRAVKRAGQRARRHGSGGEWNLTHDSSVTQGRYVSLSGWELISPVLAGESGVERVRDVCAEISRSFSYLRGRFPIVDRSCGFHVHVDTQDLSAEQFVTLMVIYGKAEEVLYRMVAPNRRTKEHCKPNSLKVDEFWCDAQYAATKVAIAELVRRHSRGSSRYDAKYRGLNLCRYATRGDVEFRMHEGCFDPDIVVSWVRLLTALVDQAKEPLSPIMAEKTWTWEMVEKLLGWAPGGGRLPRWLPETRRVLRSRYRDLRVGASSAQ